MIENCNKFILLLDNLEESRPLYKPEFNFRKIVKLHLEKLLKAQCQYWRKRCSIRWIKVGEDNTKFFHAMASQRFRRNTISNLKLDNGDVVSDHEQMAGVIYQKYKDRMGQSRGITMGFDLGNLLQPVDGLDELTRPFSKEEMDLVVKHMPSDKAPGPDGFNGLFLKKCWHIISEDFYALARDFHKGDVSLANINSSFITLVPKVNSPASINDYRPISLTIVCLKFITKLAANRL
jgi:mannosylglycoprotein endo-beta-mannosidase